MSKYIQGIFTPKNKEKCLNKDKVVYRSGWEVQVMLYLDKSPDIINWASEGIVIPYIGIDGKLHRYFVDFYVKIINPNNNKAEIFLIEVKPKRQTYLKTASKTTKNTKKRLNEEITFATNTAKWNAAEKYCKEKGWKFKIVTEQELGVVSKTPKPINFQKILF